MKRLVGLASGSFCCCAWARAFGIGGIVEIGGIVISRPACDRLCGWPRNALGWHQALRIIEQVAAVHPSHLSHISHLSHPAMAQRAQLAYRRGAFGIGMIIEIGGIVICHPACAWHCKWWIATAAIKFMI